MHNYLIRINEKGVPGIWECKCGARGSLAELSTVPCSAEPATDDELIAAIEGHDESNPASSKKTGR